MRIAKWLADALVERIQTRDKASLFLNALQSVAAQYSDKQGAVAVHAVFEALSNCGRSSGALRAIWALARMLASLDAASRTTAEASGEDAANSENAADSLVGAAVQCVRKMAGEASSSSPPPAAPSTGPEKEKEKGGGRQVPVSTSQSRDSRRALFLVAVCQACESEQRGTNAAAGHASSSVDVLLLLAVARSCLVHIHIYMCIYVLYF